MAIFAGIPLRDFDAAKGRLAGSISAEARNRLARETARRVVDAARGARFDVVVVTGSARVREWAADIGVPHVDDPPTGGLDGAAAAVASAGAPWCVIHGDLPLIETEDLAPVAAGLADGRAVLAPSRDGGTKLIAAVEPICFSYGPGSFARHLAALSGMRPLVVVRTGLAVEIDTHADLIEASRLPKGWWLARYLS